MTAVQPRSDCQSKAERSGASHCDAQARLCCQLLVASSLATVGQVTQGTSKVQREGLIGAGLLGGKFN